MRVTVIIFTIVVTMSGAATTAHAILPSNFYYTIGPMGGNLVGELLYAPGKWEDIESTPEGSIRVAIDNYDRRYDPEHYPSDSIELDTTTYTLPGGDQVMANMQLAFWGNGTFGQQHLSVDGPTEVTAAMRTFSITYPVCNAIVDNFGRTYLSYYINSAALKISGYVSPTDTVILWAYSEACSPHDPFIDMEPGVTTERTSWVYAGGNSQSPYTNTLIGTGNFGYTFGQTGPPYQPLASAIDVTNRAGIMVVLECIIQHSGAGPASWVDIGVDPEMTVHASPVPEPGTIDWQGGSSATTNWNFAANWYPDTAVPSGPGTKVSFGDQPAANNVVDMISQGQTAGTLTFFADTSTTIQSSGGFALTLDNSGSVSTIVMTGAHTISAPVILNNDAIISGPGTLILSGGIAGSHDLEVDSNLTATSIQVDTLTIGSGAKVIIAPLSGGPLALSDNLKSVPEPSAFVFLGMGAISLLAYAWRWRRE